MDALKNILLENPEKKFLIFVSRKIDCESIASQLYHQLRIKALASIHGDKSQEQRNNIIEDFRKSILRVVVATDVAARGLDVKDIDYVVNYDFPENVETYVHRIGRTARAGKLGIAISFMSPSNYSHLPALIELMKQSKQEIDPSIISLNDQLQASKRQGGGGRGFSQNRLGGFQKRNTGNPYGDKFANPQASSHQRSPYAGGGSNNRRFNTDDWIMERSGGRSQQPSGRKMQRDDSDEIEFSDDEDESMSRQRRPASRSSSGGGAPAAKSESFDELMKRLQLNNQKKS